MLSHAFDEFTAGKIGGLQASDLATIYLLTHGEADGKFTQRSHLEIYQNMLQWLSALRYAICWKALGKDKHPYKAKQKVAEAVFRAKYNIAPDVSVNRRSDLFVAFNHTHRTYIRAANRLLFAYQVFGSLLLLCPQLSFAYFRHSVLGNQLSATVKTLARSLNKAELKRRETNYQELLQLLVQSAAAEPLKTALGDFEGVMENVEPGDSLFLCTFRFCDIALYGIIVPTPQIYSPSPDKRTGKREPDVCARFFSQQ
ncbi:hypothetical protein FRC08_002341 [Ceratobasidium sp. 394]|nr:hypothetical protein FRC08_002341 [Ceratobasidium sp. 394]